MTSRRWVHWMLLSMGGIFVVGGIVMAYVLAIRPMQRAREARWWMQTTCHVISSAVERRSNSKGKTMYSAAIDYEYEALGQTYRGSRFSFMPKVSSGDSDGAQEIVARYPEGADVPCWYDPSDRASSTLSRTLEATLWFAFPLPLIVIGAFVLRFGARMRRMVARGAPASVPGRVELRRRGSGLPELVAATALAGVLGAAAYLAHGLEMTTVAAIAFACGGAAAVWIAHELRCLVSVVTIVAPAEVERDTDVRIELAVRTPYCAPPITAQAVAHETVRRGNKWTTSTVRSVEVRDGVLRVDGPPSRDDRANALEWFLEVRTHLPFGPDIRVRAPIRVR